ncbi:MAG TPA: aspartate/glutamate racemase family protein [Pyrinomonadaceae bacterium]|jgi:Asp/Glu/hydantoin racemase|nr:aspartate/glutamate racemase family protein [Pyrinomonadaceae bacterium]
MKKRKIVLIHTSPAAIAPLMRFYNEAAPELEITNLLDDGLLRLLAAGEHRSVERRLAEMLTVAVRTYEAELVMVTCSSVTKGMVERLAPLFDLPVLKIDYPMAREAVAEGRRRIGVAATFPPTLVPTSQLISEAAEEAGASIEIIREVVPEAYDALLSGDEEAHDELLCAGVERLAAKRVDVIVLAQISMARVLPRLEGKLGVPLLSSLHTSLGAIRSALK